MLPNLSHVLCFCSLSNTWHAVRHAVDTVFSKPRSIAFVSCWRFYGCEVGVIWEFMPLTFKSEDMIFLATSSQPSPLALSCPSVFFSLSASMPLSLCRSQWCLSETSGPFVSRSCPWTEQTAHERARVGYLPLSPEELISHNEVLSGFKWHS